LRIQKVDPSFSALLAISLGYLSQVEAFGNLVPVFGAVLLNQFKKFFVFILGPIYFMGASLLILIIFEFALRVIPSGHKPRNFNPIIFIKIHCI
jgi:hypothetical protein